MKKLLLLLLLISTATFSNTSLGFLGTDYKLVSVECLLGGDLHIEEYPGKLGEVVNLMTLKTIALEAGKSAILKVTEKQVVLIHKVFVDAQACPMDDLIMAKFDLVKN